MRMSRGLKARLLQLRGGIAAQNLIIFWKKVIGWGSNFRINDSYSGVKYKKLQYTYIWQNFNFTNVKVYEDGD